MNKFSDVNSHEMVEQYERLRAEALDYSKTGSRHPPGFSIVLLRGMASWINTFLCSQLLQEIPSCSKTPSNQGCRPIGDRFLHENIYSEVTKILTSLILSYQKVTRSYHV
jgi:hypothetical protein